MKIRNERERIANRKQISRLRKVIADGKFTAATTNALDRRQRADLDYFRNDAEALRDGEREKAAYNRLGREGRI